MGQGCCKESGSSMLVKKMLGPKNQAQSCKKQQKWKNGSVKNQKVVPKFEPRTWVSPARYLATGVAIHSLINVKQKQHNTNKVLALYFIFFL